MAISPFIGRFFFLVLAVLPCISAIVPYRADLADGDLALSVDDDISHGLEMTSLMQGRETNPPTSEVTYKGFFDRLMDSVSSFIFGLVLIVFSVPILWVNESRTAKLESVIEIAERSCRSVKGEKALQDNHGCLVHLEGESMVSLAEVADKDFDVAFASDCVRLRRQVEVYQVIEHQQKQSKEKLGGGKEVTTTNTYTQEWSTIWHDSSSYKDAEQRKNSKPPGLDLGVSTKESSKVAFGKGFMLPPGLVEQCRVFRSASERIGDTVSTRASKLEFAREGDFYYAGFAGGKASSSAPCVGDTRVRFEYVPNGLASVMALQVEEAKKADMESAGEDLATFLPYRLINRGFFGVSADEEKRLLRREGSKTPAELASEATIGGPLGCLCCACNLVTMCFSSLMTPEIFHLYSGSKSLSECWTSIKGTSSTTATAFRVGGWLCMFVGLCLLFSPALTLINALPFLGPFLSNFGGFAVGLFAFLVTLPITCLISGLAYLVYRPMKSLIYLGVVALIAVPFFYMMHA